MNDSIVPRRLGPSLFHVYRSEREKQTFPFPKLSNVIQTSYDLARSFISTGSYRDVKRQALN